MKLKYSKACKKTALAQQRCQKMEIKPELIFQHFNALLPITNTKRKCSKLNIHLGAR